MLQLEVFHVCCSARRSKMMIRSFHSLQSFFVVLVGFLVQTQTWGKPYTSQDTGDTSEQGDTYGQLEPNQALNETGLSRGKRQVNVLTLEMICPGRTALSSDSSPSIHPCVKKYWYCPKYNLFEVECRPISFHSNCLENIKLYGFPKCKPGRIETAILNPGTNKERHVRLTKTCKCA